MSVEKNMAIAGVPMEHKEAIEKCLNEAQKLAKKVTFYKWTAPFVMLFICPFLKWEYNELVEVMERQPFKWLSKYFKGLRNFIDRYDNNISMNGDKTDWEYADETGKFYRGQYFNRKPMRLENDQLAKDSCYYFFNWTSGRNNFARYVWLGIRNHASKYSLLLGPEVDRKLPITEYKWTEPSPKNPNKPIKTVEFYNVGDIWQMRTSEVKINYFLYSNNFGYKINNFEIDIVFRIMVVWKTFDLVRLVI